MIVQIILSATILTFVLLIAFDVIKIPGLSKNEVKTTSVPTTTKSLLTTTTSVPTTTKSLLTTTTSVPTTTKSLLTTTTSVPTTTKSLLTTTKPKQLKYKDWDGYTCSTGDVVATDYYKCANKNLEKCCKNNITLSGYCAYDVKPCDNGLSGRDPVYTNIDSPANNLTDINNKYSYNIPGYGYYYE